jgi:hypothetical protein
MIAKTLRTPDGDFFIEIPLVVEVEVSGNGEGSVNSVNQEIWKQLVIRSARTRSTRGTAAAVAADARGSGGRRRGLRSELTWLSFPG